MKKIILALPLLLAFSGSALAVGGRQTMNVVVKSYKPYFEVCFYTTDLNSKNYCATVEGDGTNWMSHTYDSHKTYHLVARVEASVNISGSCKALGFKDVSSDNGYVFEAVRPTAHSKYKFAFTLKPSNNGRKPAIYCREYARD